jgi:hypothetical protein
MKNPDWYHDRIQPLIDRIAAAHPGNNDVAEMNEAAQGLLLDAACEDGGLIPDMLKSSATYSKVFKKAYKKLFPKLGLEDDFTDLNDEIDAMLVDLKNREAFLNDEEE